MKIKSKELCVCWDVCQVSSVSTLEISLLRRAFLTDEIYHNIVHYKWLTLLYSREIQRFTPSSRVYKKQDGTSGFIPRILLYDTAKELCKWLKPQVKLLWNWKRTWITSEVISVEFDISSSMLFQINVKMWTYTERFFTYGSNWRAFKIRTQDIEIKLPN